MEGQLPGGCPSISIVICRLQSSERQFLQDGIQNGILTQLPPAKAGGLMRPKGRR